MLTLITLRLGLRYYIRIRVWSAFVSLDEMSSTALGVSLRRKERNKYLVWITGFGTYTYMLEWSGTTQQNEHTFLSF